ncbi:exodeoxyribonuclease III [Desulfonatronovibrio hydrogenovorans]|uniref:exodeoxyribonuclease III n=1 Tax=Desulfonatronovibrio hydrogenovorans TaxID=53245 RepID=UPI000490F6D7|nr:exodeoxyribonuclease III [Desulfonatronovibrio hydrogenovorans]
MIIHSWNVNGFRAVVGKGFWDWFQQSDSDVVCLQETKARLDQLEERDRSIPGYDMAWNPSRAKQGYSGVASFFRVKPLKISTGLPEDRFQGEGRLICMEYEDFHLLNVYFPNGQMNEERLKFKLDYYDSFLNYAEELRKSKPIVVCGDFNTAHKEIDLKNPKANQDRSGFLPIERQWLDRFISHGYVDTFRMFNQEPDQYTWWTYRFGARSRNAGWRIDYFFVSEELKSKVLRSWIEPGVKGSDHCPIGLELEM